MSATYIYLFAGFATVIALAIFSYSLLAKQWSIKELFKDFNRKIWMTISLGCLFIGIYFFVVLCSIYLAESLGSDLIFVVYRYPVEFIYGGLFLFACMTLCIYLARMVIKYFYLTRGKDS